VDGVGRVSAVDFSTPPDLGAFILYFKELDPLLRKWAGKWGYEQLVQNKTKFESGK
jgi:hypothetical protein